MLWIKNVIITLLKNFVIGKQLLIIAHQNKIWQSKRDSTAKVRLGFWGFLKKILNIEILNK